MILSEENVDNIKDIVNMYKTMSLLRRDHTNQDDYEDIRNHILKIREHFLNQRYDSSLLHEISEMNWTRWNSNLSVDFWKIAKSFKEI